MRSEPSPTRSRTRGQHTATGPMPVMISRSGRCPWRTSRWRPSSVSLSAWQLSKAATSASIACAKSARAPLRNTSVSGSAKVPGWESWKTLVSVTAYHSFGGEVEASNTPTIRRIIPSCRHQSSPIAPGPLMRTHGLMGLSFLHTGDVVDARAHLDRAITLYNPAEHRPLATRFGQDVGAATLCWKSLAFWLLGYPQAALADTEHALKVAREIGHSATLMYVLNFSAW